MTTAIPPEQRAEEATKAHIRSLQLKLGALLCELSEHENSRLSVTDWCRRVTGYEREGRSVKGYADYRCVMSIDRLEKSIEDGKVWLTELGKGKA